VFVDWVMNTEYQIVKRDKKETTDLPF
jgi:hypothetical protein